MVGVPRRTAAMLAVVVLGLGLNLREWILLAPRLTGRTDVCPGRYVVLVGLPLLVAALLRLPVGVLTDRYGARVMFPAVSVLAAGSAFALGLSDALPVVLVAGAAAGVAGTAYVVGAAFVSRLVGYGRRGSALGVFSLGTAVAVLVSAVSWAGDQSGRRASLVLGAALLGFAGVAAAVLRDPVGDAGAGSAVRRCVHMVRLASRTSLSLLYGLALGGLVAVAVYLPAYLTDVFGLRPFPTLAVTAVVVVLASLARLAGGWWTDRHPTARALLVCYAVAAGLCLVVALAPRVWWLTSALVAGVAICDGLASGALLALIGKAARPESTGAVMGVTGAVAAFGPVCLSLLLAGVEQLTGSYVVAWFLLAVVLLAVAWYVYLRGLQIGLGLAVRHELSPSPAAMTIAVVGEAETRWGAAAVVARLAELAARDELVVVYGSDDVGNSRRDRNPLVVGLRDRLPRYRIEAIPVRPETGPLGADAAVFDEFVATGAVAVAVTPTPELGGVAAQLSTYLQADRVLKVSYTLNAGARLHKVWDRRPSWTPADSG